MQANDIGGFFVKIGANVDRSSFETGVKAIDAVTNKLTKFAGTARNVAAIVGAYTIASSKIEHQELRTAEALGMSVIQLDKWKTAAKLMNVQANGLVSSMGQMQSFIQRWKLGELDQGLTTKLSNLYINLDSLKDMSADEQLRTILESARAMEDQQLAAEILKEILGQTGVDFYESIKLSGRTLDDILEQAGSMNLMTEADYKKSLGFDNEVNESKAYLDQFGKKFGADLAGELTPIFEDLNKFYKEHGKNIAAALSSLAKDIGIIARWISAVVKATYKGVQEAKKVVKESNDVKEKHNTWWANVAGGVGGFGNYFGFMMYDPSMNKSSDDGKSKKSRKEQEEEAAARVAAQMAQLEEMEGILNGVVPQEANDGILRPNGTLTKVAPDDWVFAVRNLGDLASAFLPMGNAGTNVSAPSSYSIQQTFNVNGSNLSAHTLKQAAYTGTQSAIMQSMEQAARRNQFMTGLR